MTEINIKITENTPIKQLILMQKFWSKEFAEVNIFKG